MTGTTAGPDTSEGRTGTAVRVGMALICAYMLGIGVFAIVAPGVFYETLGPFGTRNDHYTIDGATFMVAFGIGALVAIRHESWRVPVVLMVLVQNAVHTVNHLVDIGEADPGWVGVFDFLVLLAGGVLLVWFLRWSASQARTAPTATDSSGSSSSGAASNS